MAPRKTDQVRTPLHIRNYLNTLRTNSRARLFACAALLLFFRVTLIAPFDQPFLFADEAGYLGDARYLSGGGITRMITTAFYNFGYSLWLVPLQWVNDPALSYKAALGVNCIASILLFIVLYKCIGLCFILHPSQALFISVIASLYPACSYWPYVAMSESFCMLAFAIVSWLLLRFQQTKSSRDLMFFCAACAYSFALHARFTALPLLALLLLLSFRSHRFISWREVVYGTAWMTGILILTTMVNTLLQRAMWEPPVATFGSFVSLALMRLAHSAGSLEGIWRIGVLLAGEASYLATATYGIVPVAVVFMVNAMRDLRNTKCPKKANNALIFVFVLIAAASIVSFSVVNLSVLGPPRPNAIFMLFGRYADAFVPLFLTLGLASYTADQKDASYRGFRLRTMAIWLSLLGPAIVLLAFGSPEINSGIGLHESVSLHYAVGLFSRFDFARLILIATIAAVLSDVLLKKNLFIGGGLLLSAFLAASMWNYHLRINEQNEQRVRTQNIVSELRKLHCSALSLDASAFEPSAFFGIQYLLSGTSMEIFRSAKGEMPRQNVILAGLQWSAQFDPQARAVAATPWKEGTPIDVVWIRRGDANYARYVSMKRPIFVNYPADDPSIIGEIAGLSRVATPQDKPGYLVFGPYIPLLFGEYSLSVDYSVSNVDEERASHWDIVLGSTVLEKGEFKHNGNQLRLETSFVVPVESSGSNFEFRVYYRGKGIVRIDKIALRSSGNEVDPNLGNGQIFVDNGNFESSSTRPWQAFGAAELTVASDVVHEGKHSLSVTGSPSEGALQDVAVLSFREYTISAWVWVPPASEAQLYLDDTQMNPVTLAIKPTNGSWKFVSLRYKSSETGKIRVHLWRVKGTSPIYWDDVTIRQSTLSKQ